MNVGFKKRFMAWGIDFALTTVVGFVLAIGAAALLGVELAPRYYDEKPILMASAYVFVPMLVDWLYFAGFHASKKQATPGKMMLKIVVTTDRGDRLGFGKATLRYIAKTICFYTLGVGFLTIRYTKRKQGLHDLFAGTVVVDSTCCDHDNIMDFMAYRGAHEHKKAK